MTSEVSVCGKLVPWFWICGKADHCVSAYMVNQSSSRFNNQELEKGDV